MPIRNLPSAKTIAYLLLGCFSGSDAPAREGADAPSPVSLPNFSFAGGERGDTPTPPAKPDLWVTDFGAKGDGTTRCDNAFQSAIAQGAGKVIGIPPGTFVLSERLIIDIAHTVLQGAGPEKTTLLFTRSLEEIDPSPTKNSGGTPTSEWSWSGGLITLGSPMKTNGKRVTITAPASRGATRLEGFHPPHLAVGKSYRLELRDLPESTALIRALYRDQPGDLSDIKPGSFTVSQPVSITSISNQMVTLNRSIRFDLTPQWRTTLVEVDTEGHHIGLSHLSLRFPPRPYAGHFKEEGLNGVRILGRDNWVSHVHIHNADSGLFVYGQFHRITDLILDGTRLPHSNNTTGHHGISLLGSDCLVARFNINTRFIHDLTVSRGSVGNVFSEGRAVDLAIDHHRYAPYENLFTQIHAGSGTRIWKSGGGKGRGAYTASGATFWNIDSTKPFALPPASFGPPGCTFAGLNLKPTDPKTVPKGWQVNPASPATMHPANLYRAQRAQ